MSRWSNGDVSCRASVHLSSEFEGEELPSDVVPINSPIKIHWFATAWFGSMSDASRALLASSGEQPRNRNDLGDGGRDIALCLCGEKR